MAVGPAPASRRRGVAPVELTPAAAVAYLAGPRAAYITGQTLLLDGGLVSY